MVFLENSWSIKSQRLTFVDNISGRGGEHQGPRVPQALPDVQELQALHRHLHLGHRARRRHLLSRLLPQNLMVSNTFYHNSSQKLDRFLYFLTIENDLAFWYCCYKIWLIKGPHVTLAPPTPPSSPARRVSPTTAPDVTAR